MTDNVGINIRITRESKGLSQKQLAAKAGIGQSTLSRYERGDRQPETTQLQAIANALDASVQVFLRESSESGPAQAETPAGCSSAADDSSGSHPGETESLPVKSGPNFAENVRMAREAAGMAVEELAVRAGSTTSTIRRYENGTIKRPSLEALLKLAAVLDVDAKDLLPGAEYIYDLEGAGSKPKAQPPRNEFGETLARNIIKFREASGLSRSEIARRAGMTESSLRRYESGQMQRPCLVRMQLLAAALGATVHDLVPGYELMPRCALPPNTAPVEPGQNVNAVPQTAARTAPQAPSAHADQHRWLSVTAHDGAKTRYFNGPLSELIRGISPEDVKPVADYAKFVLGMPANDPAVATDLPGQWLGITAQDGTDTQYYHGPLGDLLYNMTPENVRQVIAYARFVRQQAGLQ